VNEVKVQGSVASDPIIRTTKNAHKVGNFIVSVQNPMGTGRSFIPVVGWDSYADIIEKLVKGDEVKLSGSLKQDRWEKDGENRNKVKIVARDVSFVLSDRSQEKVAVAADEDSDIPF